MPHILRQYSPFFIKTVQHISCILHGLPSSCLSFLCSFLLLLFFVYFTATYFLLCLLFLSSFLRICSFLQSFRFLSCSSNSFFLPAFLTLSSHYSFIGENVCFPSLIFCVYSSFRVQVCLVILLFSTSFPPL